MEILLPLIALALGVFIGILINKNKEQQRQQQLLQEREHFSAELQHTQQRLQEQEQRHQNNLQTQEKNFQKTIETVTAQMQVATNEMLKARQKEFAEASNINIGQLVNPLKDTIDKMKKAMEDTTRTQTSMSSEMKTNLEHMMRQSQAAQQSAEELARVFKHGSKVQGDWGETVLNELLTSQGLTEGIHYDTQTTIRDAKGNIIKTEEGNLMRPDVILHLDTQREVIIDSKVSLTSFIDYVNANDEPQRQAALKAHIDSLKKHVKELSKKDYSAYIKTPKVRMNYVVMFVPHSGALWTALNAEPTLWRNAMEQNVFIADEQTLFAALKIINLTWTQIVQAQNHEKVYELANEMLNRIGQFWKSYETIGKALKSAQTAYEEGEKKITDGGHSINTTAQQLIQLGAHQNANNPLPGVDTPMLPQ